MPRQTYFATTGDIPTTWRHIDADGKVLGRLATEVATIAGEGGFMTRRQSRMVRAIAALQ